MSQNEKVPFRLAEIHTREFATFEDHLEECLDNEEKEGGLKAGITYAIDDENAAIECSAKANILLNKKVIIAIEVSCEFDIEPNAWESINHNNQLIIPMELARHLGVITIGTLRGILHAKTENTPFNKYYLPTVNVAEMVDEDVEFDIE